MRLYNSSQSVIVRDRDILAPPQLSKRFIGKTVQSVLDRW